MVANLHRRTGKDVACVAYIATSKNHFKNEILEPAASRASADVFLLVCRQEKKSKIHPNPSATANPQSFWGKSHACNQKTAEHNKGSEPLLEHELFHF